ncbi:MAG TPA: hypothetical protein VMV46_11925 [Thermoanaerobaculia bacterium]|nr:hypothetical protein [Thermoanaerobaculia bacterium]
MPAHPFRCVLGRVLAVVLLALLGALPALAYRIYLRDGTMLAAREKYTVREDLALVTLENGTQTTVRLEEIDVEKTERLNQRAYTSAVVIEGGEERLLSLDDPAMRQRTLAEYVRERQEERAERAAAAESQRRLRRTGAGYVDLRLLPREPAEGSAASQVAEKVRAHGVLGARVSRGTGADRYLIDVLAENETAVFSALEDLAAALLELADAGARVEAFEVYLASNDGSRAGMFTLTEDTAALLASDQLEPAQFFLQFVEF